MVFILFLFSSRALNDHLIVTTHKMKGFPGRSVVKNLPAMPVTGIWSLGREDPLKKEMAIHFSIHALRNPMYRGAWRAIVQRSAKSQTWHRDWAHRRTTYLKPQCDGIWSWGLWEIIGLDDVMRMDGAPMVGISTLIRRGRDARAPSANAPTIWGQNERIAAYKSGRHLTRTLPGWFLDLGCLVSRTVRNRFLLLKLPSLWHFVTTAQAD